MTELEYDAFISYASPDLAFAEEVHRRLCDAGFKVWFDKARLNPGCDWHREIEHGCEASRVLLPVLTPRWKTSEWTKFETYGAEAVIPLIVEGDITEIFTPPLTRFQGQAVDFGGGPAAMGDAAWEKLFAALRTLLQQPAPDKLERLADVRYPANPYFVGRERELNQIHEELHHNPTAVLTQGRVRAIAALGGVGKTTLARQYAEKFWRCYPQIFWGDCRLGVESELARLCDFLLPQHRESTNVPEKAQLTLQALQTRDERLLIYDNAEDEQSLQAWIPKTGHCRTLITSRFASWSAAVKSIHLYVLDPDPAHTLLATRAGRESFAALSVDEQSACAALAKELGYLPLALEQAAAYVEQQGTGFSFADYLQLYASAAAELLDEGVLGSTEYPDSVITTWKATTDKLAPAARGILRLCSFLSSTPLPLSALFDGIDVLCEEAEAVACQPLPDVGQAELWVRKQVQQLRAYSMVEDDGHSIALHPLVQTVERHQLDQSPGVLHATLLRALGWISSVFEGDPQDVRDWPKLDPIPPHALAVASHADRANIFEPTHSLIGDTGTIFLAKAQFSEAEPLIRRALAIVEQAYGPKHLDVAIYLNNLAVLLKDTNRLAEAEPLMRRALAIDEQSYGAEHPRVAIGLNNLAQLLQATNRLAEAEPLMRRSLAIDEQFYGADHPRVAIDLSNMALLLLSGNRLAEAEPMIRRALSIDERSYGAEHPNVARDLSHLAQLFEARNHLAEAEPLYRRALAINEYSYGTKHPRIAIDLNNLAGLLQATNRLAEAEPLYRRALSIDEQTYGAEHPDVARDLNNLAALLKATNRLAEAEPLMRRALAIDEQSLGTKHPMVATRLSNLAVLLVKTNRLAEAEPLMRRALSINEQSYGTDHPQVAICLNNLALLLQEKATFAARQDERKSRVTLLAEARKLLQQALEIFQKSLGDQHPNTITIRKNHASISSMLRDRLPSKARRKR